MRETAKDGENKINRNENRAPHGVQNIFKAARETKAEGNR
jgi:hypothetical protein